MSVLAYYERDANTMSDDDYDDERTSDDGGTTKTRSDSCDGACGYVLQT